MIVQLGLLQVIDSEYVRQVCVEEKINNLDEHDIERVVKYSNDTLNTQPRSQYKTNRDYVFEYCQMISLIKECGF